MKESNYPILKYFNYGHLPAHLQELSKPFFNLAHFIDSDERYKDGAEKSVALRKLLEAKDAAVRSAL